MFLRWIHRAYRLTRWVSLWVRRRLTTTGMFVAAGALMAAGASNTEQTVALQAFLLSAGMLGTAMVWAPFFRARLGLQRQPPRFVTVGEPFHLRVDLQNLTPKPQRGLEYLENIQEPPLTLSELSARTRPGRRHRNFRTEPSFPPFRGAQTQCLAIPTLPPMGRTEISVKIVAWRRGPLMLAGAWIGRPDPLGLFRGFQKIGDPHTVLVLPKRYALPPLRLPGNSHYQRGGVEFASGIGEAEEFVALRDYRRGDSLRRVHWRSAARLGKLVVKEFQDEYLVRHALVLDTCCEASRDLDFEEAVAVAASFACTVPDQESLLDLMFVGPRAISITAGRGVGHSEQLLEVLATAKPCREPRVSELEGLILRHRDTLSGVILVLLDWDEPRRQLVRQLKVRQLPVWVLLMGENSDDTVFRETLPEERPNRWILLQPGQVAEGLQHLKSL